MGHVLESEFEHEGLKCVVILTDRGHRCGYVAVGEDSPLFGVDYSEDLKSSELLNELKEAEIGKRGIIPVFCWDGKETSPEILFNVHGGLTYSGGGEDYPINSSEKLWWFGFDCAHLDDAKDWQAMRDNFPKEQWEKLYQIDMQFQSPNDVVRTKDYVEAECRSLAEQIRCAETAF